MLRYLLGFVLMAVPLTSYAHSNPHQQEKSMHKKITADQLKSWYDQKKAMTVLDARSKPYFDGTLLPNARWLPSESTEKEIRLALPSKDALIVVYCLGVTCPASGWLYDKLTSMGYTHVFEYHEGIEDWLEKGYPTTKREQS